MKSLLALTTIAILISGAPAAWAQPDDRGRGKHQDRAPNAQQEQAGPDQGQADRGQRDRGRRGEAPAQVQAAPAAAPAPIQPPVQAQARPEREQRQQREQAQTPNQIQAPVQAQARPEREQRQQRQEAQAPRAPVQQAAPLQAQARPERQQGQRSDRMQRQDNSQGTFRAQVQPQAQPQAQPQIQSRPAPQIQASRNNQAVPPQHVQQRNQWRSNNQDWNRSTVWQRDRNWWRGNDAFRNYSGVRLNFFFAPGFGYYSVPSQYRRHSWHAGDYLPRYFMRYVVNDYRSYGLPRPPNNCRWIWVNNSILLVDRSDRYILDEVSDIW
jgi:Ni/Co efflux regulator RcnB